MSNTKVDHVIATLQNGGMDAAAAFPGQKIPALGAPRIAVGLEEISNAGKLCKILATVYSPGKAGGYACEAAAQEAMAYLLQSGADCRLEGCSYDGQLDCFFMRLHAAYEEPEPEEEVVSPYTVTLGGAPLAWVVSFRAWQETDDPAITALGSTAWLFQVEEQLPPGAADQNTPTEPFSLTVNRDGVAEVFSECRLTGLIREDSAQGLYQKRIGIAGNREYSSIL